MEVILKKTKISNSILKQCLRATDTDFVNGVILGWCIFDKMRYIICYNESSKSLTKYPLFKEIDCEEFIKNDKKQFSIKVRLGGNYMPISYITNEEIEKDVLISCLKKAKKEAEQKGQFFI